MASMREVAELYAFSSVNDLSATPSVRRDRLSNY